MRRVQTSPGTSTPAKKTISEAQPIPGIGCSRLPDPETPGIGKPHIREGSKDGK